jgi:hypothetical protein
MSPRLPFGGCFFACGQIWPANLGRRTHAVKQPSQSHGDPGKAWWWDLARRRTPLDLRPKPLKARDGARTAALALTLLQASLRSKRHGRVLAKWVATKTALAFSIVAPERKRPQSAGNFSREHNASQQAVNATALPGTFNATARTRWPLPKGCAIIDAAMTLLPARPATPRYALQAWEREL